MAETLLSFGVNKLLDLLVQESRRFQGVEEQFNELKSDLSMLRCFLKDADAKKHTSEMVRNTVSEIKEIVYDAEDIIQTFLLKEELGNTSGIRKSLRRFSCVIVEHRGISFDMEAISKKISKVIRDMQSLGIQQVIGNDEYMQSLQERQKEMRQTFPYDNESNLVGLEENVKKLVGYLVEEAKSQVVSITGMGGIGKTTLARQVFNHETVKSHFAGLAWVCVSQHFTREYVWRIILRKLKPEYKVLEMAEDELQEKLFQVLETQKALIVLDDIWREEDWDRIKPMFPREKGWKVLLTSRNEGVALRADPNCFTFKPDCLTLEEGWTIIRRISFPRETTTEHNVDEEMEELGKQMIKHCGGLPLAVKVLGGLLAAQYTLREWKRIYDNIRSHIVGGTSFTEKNISSVYHVLYLSFEELPIYLKHCFLYLAHFPEDYPIEMEELSWYLAGEEIPRPRYYDRESIRDVAEGYIEELVKRNMVISERDDCTSRFEACQLHDMMREVCLLKAEDENFLESVDNTSSGKSKSPFKSRRLVVHCADETFHMDWKMKNPKLRSLLFSVKVGRDVLMDCGLLFARLQLMRILDLSGAMLEGGKLPSSIGELIHLRYLSLYKAYVTQLPSSMRNLKLLIYLNLCVAKESKIYMPNFLNEMRELTYLSLPLNKHHKGKLELSNLVNLETLENFSTEHGRVRDLQGMTRLRALSIYIRGEGCTMETLSSSLSELKHLKTLTINGYKVYAPYAPTKDKEGLFLDCVHHKKTKLSIYMPRLPDEQHLPSHLTTISLRDCYLEEDPMPILEKLLQLKEFFLEERAFCGRRMVCSADGFPQLHKLVIWGLSEWKEWIVEEGSMLLLHTLTITCCEELKGLPDGLRFIYSLKELCMEEDWEGRLSEGGEDYYKVQHIPYVKFAKILDDMQMSPFSEEITNVRLGLASKLELSYYNGNEDPQLWLTGFQIAMQRQRFDTPKEHEANHCQTFIEHLSEDTLKWFSSLPPGSIKNFEDLSGAFIKHYSMYMMKHTTNLFTLTQEKYEPLRQFIEKFKIAAAAHRNIPHTLSLEALRGGLWFESDFKKELQINEPATLEDALHRAQTNMKIEEEKPYYAKKHGMVAVAVQKEVNQETHLEKSKPASNVSNALPEKQWNTWNMNDVQTSRPPLSDVDDNHDLWCRFHGQTGHATSTCQQLLDSLMGKYHDGEIEIEGDRSQQGNQGRSYINHRTSGNDSRRGRGNYQRRTSADERRQSPPTNEKRDRDDQDRDQYRENR